MITNGIPKFNVNDPTGSDNNSYGGGDFGFDGINYQVDPPNSAGPSPGSTGADVWRELDDYPALPSPPVEPASLYLGYGVYLSDGKSCCTH